jgi:hypothetical protein
MATVVLQAAGAAVGTLLGGPVGGLIGRALGAVAGSFVDQQLFGSSRTVKGPRLTDLRVMASSEGAPIPRLWGSMRIAGQVIWATDFEEKRTTEREGGKGGGGSRGTKVRTYSYFANFAVGLCEGEIDRIGRVWADGKEFDLSGVTTRLYRGSETQEPDSLMVAKLGAGNAAAYRGLAYIVFERLPLADFGNRLPQLSFEVIRAGGGAETHVRAVSIIPGATEFGYDTTVVTREVEEGVTETENAHAANGESDWNVSVGQLVSSCRNLQWASLVTAWFGTDLRCGFCEVKPGVDNRFKLTEPETWLVSGTSRAEAHEVSESGGGPAYGGTPSDASVIRAIRDLKARGIKVMFHPFVLMDIAADNGKPDPYGDAQQAAYPWRGRITCSVAPGRVGVRQALTREVSAEQFSALVSFAFNVGIGAFRRSSVLKAVNAGDFTAVPERLKLWVKADGRRLEGLVRRRAAEAELFATRRALPIAKERGGLVGLLIALIRLFTGRKERT